MKVEIAANEINGYVDIKASPERIYHALLHTSEWWGGPDNYKVTRSEIPTQVGGDWISEGVGNDGTTFHVKGKVLAADPPKLLSYTWNPSWEVNMPETTVTFRLEPIDSGTRVHVQHGSFANFDESAKDHYKGWEKVLGWLRDYSEK